MQLCTWDMLGPGIHVNDMCRPAKHRCKPNAPSDGNSIPRLQHPQLHHTTRTPQEWLEEHEVKRALALLLVML